MNASWQSYLLCKFVLKQLLYSGLPTDEIVHHLKFGKQE